MNALRASIIPSALIFLWALLAAGGCRYSVSSPGLLPDSTLVNVLADLHLAASRAEIYGEPSWDWHDSVMTAYGVDSTRLRRTLLKHAEQPERFIHLYSAVLDRLNERWNSRGLPSPSGLDTLNAPAAPIEVPAEEAPANVP